ncbi:MAG: MobQ family relaxase [Thauera sp.]
MAIFHLSHKAISRGQGQSIVAAAAYQSRGRIRDERSGQVKDYTRKAEQELLFSGVYAPKNAPEWARDRGALWNAAERAEDEHNRTSSRVAITGQHIEIALPNELTAEQNRYAVQDFIRENFTRHGYAVDLNIHGPDRDGDQRNIHAHLLITMRTLNEKGFSPVKLQMDRTELSKWVTHWRQAWAKTANRHLERHGHEARIDHRSLEAQGIDREASQHLGPTAAKMEREGKASERGNENRATDTRNRRRWERLGELHRELSQVNGQIATEQARSAQAYSMEDAQNPTVGWWKAARARAAMHTPTPTQAHAQAAGPRPSPKQATAQRATPPPTPTLSPTEALEKLARARKAARALREREEQQRREREERQPGRSIADDWLDAMLNKKDGPR